jgi:type I restriction enzyme S subunit
MGSCGTFISDSTEYLVKDAISKFNIIIVPVNTILLSFKLTVGRVAITDKELTTNEAIARFRLYNENLREYTYLLLKSFNYDKLGSTSSIANAVNSKIIKKIPILVPDSKTLSLFHNIAKPIFE